MSEFINNKRKRVEYLLKFSLGLINDGDGFALVQKYKETLDNITPYDILEMEEKQLQQGIRPKQIKDKIEKMMNVLYASLKKYEWEKPQPSHPLYNLMKENRELEKILHKIKQSLHKKDFAQMVENIKRLPDFNKHFIRKENILFPFLEKKMEFCRPLTVMWSLHDDIRIKWKEIATHIEEEKAFTQIIYNDLGELFFLMYGMIFKEELVLFPVAMETLAKDDWQKMIHQEFEIGFSYIEMPKSSKNIPEKMKKENSILSDIFFKVETGELSQEQIEIILNTLPVDITFIDKNDEVKYFSNPEERFFPRSAAIIGRKVQKCHPPESVHIVEKILKAFKSGDKTKADFWIQMHGKYVLIRYYALRNGKGEYIGALEVSQDITDIRQIEGERRLLNWE